MTPAPTTLVEAWSQRVARRPEHVALAYFDGALTAAETDRASDALAAALAARGVGRGDHVGIYLQNVPQYALVLLAVWKLGAAALVLNPMYRRQELRRLVDDAGAVALVCDDTDLAETRATLEGSSVTTLLSTSSHDFQDRDDPRVFGDLPRAAASPDGDLGELVREYDGQRPPPAEVSPDDVALLAYTSGTTGPPKGAMNTHANVLAVATTYADWVGLEDGDVVLAIAPLFHITGVVVNATMSLITDTTLVLAHRFRPEVVLDAITEHRATFTIGSITAFNAIAGLEEATAERLASLRTVYSGGAPIPPATVERFEQRFGLYIHNVYGMTETTSAVVAVPRGQRAPVHEASGTLSVGKPVADLQARVVDPEGNPLPAGQQGELELRGPAVVPGYWNNPEATRGTMPEGRLRTGDGAIIDDAGWIYLVDRLKDQINVSGYKVWPREVEDVLYEHEAVHEAAVVGLPDDYSGERVVAYVSLKPGTEVTEDDLVALVRDRLAAYKCPREVHVIEDLPKTQTGKIRRTALRER